MPEGPEVRIISEYLNKVWQGKLIISLGWDSKSKFNKKPIKGLDLIRLPCKVVSMVPRGKCIIIECVQKSSSKTIYMVSQLGMEGKWIHTKDKYSNFRIYFGNLNKEKTSYEIQDKWYFSDSRHFGHFNIYSDLETTICKSHGPCFLTTALVSQNILMFGNLKDYQTIVTLNKFIEKIKSKRITGKEICDFLMEQKYFSGVGNYLRAEILYRSKINPHKTLGSFDKDDITNLYNIILKQMLIAYGAKGLTIRSYHDPENNTGKCPLQVYKKQKDPYNNLVETFQDKSKRTVHWVPAVQTLN